MTVRTPQEIAEGQIWRDRYRKPGRFVRIVKIWHCDWRGDTLVRIRTCSIDGHHVRGPRESDVNRDRFIKSFDCMVSR